MKISLDLIQNSFSFINPINERELDLRDNKIPAIENLGVTNDQHDTVDLTSNDITVLGDLPYMPRLKSILLSNNRIQRVEELNVPNLDMLIMNNNEIQNYADLKELGKCKKLRYLSLIDNPITHMEHYRLYVVYLCKELKMLDFKRVSQEEREKADKLFESGELMEQLNAASSGSNTFEVGSLKETTTNLNEIKEAIAQSKTLDEINRLEEKLRSGKRLK